MKKRVLRERAADLCLIMLSIIVLLPPQCAGAFYTEMEEICRVMAAKITQSGKKNVAVTDFTDLQGNVTELGRFIGERFSVSLAQRGEGFAVIDRMHIKALLRQHKLSESGLIDPNTARKLGRIAGIDALIVGTLASFGDTVEMAIKILDTETAKIIYAQPGKLPKTDAIKSLSERELTPAKPGSAGEGKAKTGPAKAQQQQAAYGFLVELFECERLGSSVRCRFRVTNNEQDRRFVLHGFGWSASVASRLFDDAGNEYRSTGVRLGRLADKSSVDNVLPAAVPTAAELQFEGISAQAHIIRLLELRIFTPHSDYFSVKFHNVPFSK